LKPTEKTTAGVLPVVVFFYPGFIRFLAGAVELSFLQLSGMGKKIGRPWKESAVANL